MDVENENVGVLERAVTPTGALETEIEPPPRHHPLPDEPLVVIEASRTWEAVNLRDLWAYRELLFFLIWRDLKVRYRQTALGVIWVVMQPLLMTLVFTVFLGQLVRVPSDGIPYPLFAYAALLPWTYFTNAVSNSGNSLVSNAHLITKVYFPRIIIPASAVGGRLVDFFVSFVILIGMMVYYRAPVTASILMIPVLAALITLFSLALGMWISALNVKYRDIGIALPVLMQLWMFVSPVAYPSSLVPETWRWLYSLNPMAGIIEGFRNALFGREVEYSALLSAAAATLVLFVYSVYAFRRMEKTFADIV
jgi:lipopolysaccharide transport system permease protein